MDSACRFALLVWKVLAQASIFVAFDCAGRK